MLRYLPRSNLVDSAAFLEFSAADALAFYCLPLAGMVSAKFWDFDPLDKLEGAAGMMAKVAERDSAKKIAESQKG